MPLHHVRARAAFAVLALTMSFILGAASTASAQTPTSTPTPTPSTMVIEVPDPDHPDLLPGFTNRELFGDRYAVFADGALCAEGDVPAEGSFAAVLGEPDQPELCRTPGARVEIAGLGAGSFTFETTVSLGNTVTLTNWGPYPMHTPYPLYVCAWLDEQGVEHSACSYIGGAPGDAALWQFAPRFIFGDERAVIALVSLMDVPYEYAQPVPPANGDEALLLQAAGILNMEEELQLSEARACRIWHPSDPDAPGFVGIAETIGSELARVLAGFGLPIAACEQTEDAAAADVLLWREGTPPPVSLAGYSPDGSFLVSTSAPAGPTNGAPTPAEAGNAGIASLALHREGASVALLMLALTLAGAGAARIVARQ